MSEFAQTTAPLCTYALSGTNLVHQAIYLCQTCYGDSGKCCCSCCAMTCHDGHDVQYMTHGRAYCDCGSDSCGQSSSSQAKAMAEEVLAPSTHRSIALDEYGRIEVASGTNLPIFDFSVAFLHFNKALVWKECVGLVNFSKETFWIQADKMHSPRCGLEAMATVTQAQPNSTLTI